MKIAVTVSGEGLNAAIDRRFGRAVQILVHDTQSQTASVTDNTQNLNAAQGAGIQAAQNVVKTGAQALISGHCGPKAFRVLRAAGIAVYSSTAETAQQAIDLYLAGELPLLDEADVEGHWI